MSWDMVKRIVTASISTAAFTVGGLLVLNMWTQSANQLTLKTAGIMFGVTFAVTCCITLGIEFMRIKQEDKNNWQ